MQVQGNTCLHFTPGKRTRGPEKERKKGRSRREKERKKQGWDRYLEKEEEFLFLFSKTQREEKRWTCLPGWPSKKAVSHSLPYHPFLD